MYLIWKKTRKILWGMVKKTNYDIGKNQQIILMLRLQESDNKIIKGKIRKVDIKT